MVRRQRRRGTSSVGRGLPDDDAQDGEDYGQDHGQDAHLLAGLLLVRERAEWGEN